MALSAYMTVKAQTQGAIAGGVIQKGREASTIIVAISHAIATPKDVATGQSTGKRIHRPIVATAPVDKAFPLYYQALVNNENLPTVTFKFWAPQTGFDRTTAAGSEVQHLTIELTNASFSTIEFRLADNRHAETSKLSEYLEYAFVYQKITWTWNQGGVTASDDWNDPKA